MEITSSFVKAHLPEIKKEYNKFDRGRLLVIAGSYGMAGAAYMAARAALMTGVGFLNLAIPESIYVILATAFPEVVFTVYKKPEDLLPAMEKASAVAVGPGLGALRDTVCPYVFSHCKKPLIIDADGLNALAGMLSSGNAPAFSTKRILVTPHEGEMARLLSCKAEAVHADRVSAVLALQEKIGCAVLLKGPETLVKGKGALLVNRTGGPYLAVAGSGDVLTGIIASLAAQGASLADSAAMGAFIHGKSGDFAASIVGARSCRPMEVMAVIPAVLREIEGVWRTDPG